MLLHHLAHRFQGRGPEEGRPAGEHFIEDCPQAEDVRSRGELSRAAGGLLGRHVGRRADRRPRLGDRALPLQQAGQAEIGQVRFTAGVEEDVGGLEIAMEHAALMGVMDGAGERGQEHRRLARREGRLPVGQPLRQGGALHQLHRQEVPAVVLSDFVDGHDVGMVEAGGGAGFGLKAGDAFRGAFLPGFNQFQGDQPPQAALPSPIHDAHAAARDFPEQLVIAEAVPGGRRRNRPGLRLGAKEFTPQTVRTQSTRGVAGQQMAASRAGATV